MAIDTAQKRASTTGVGVPFVINLIPDGALDQGDRQTICMSYRGVLAVTAIVQIIGDVTASFVDSGIRTEFKPDEVTTEFKPDEIIVNFN